MADTPKKANSNHRGFMKNRITAVIMAWVCVLVIGGVASGQEPLSLREWFNKLQNPRHEVCCHNFDGVSLDEADWRTLGDRYQVLVQDKWVDVPADTVITEPNRLGRAHLWLRYDGSVRCFLPGSGV